MDIDELSDCQSNSDSYDPPVIVATSSLKGSPFGKHTENVNTSQSPINGLEESQKMEMSSYNAPFFQKPNSKSIYEIHCYDCGLTFAKEEECQAHLCIHEAAYTSTHSSQQTLTCNVCGHHYLDTASMKLHFQQNHALTDPVMFPLACVSTVGESAIVDGPSIDLTQPPSPTPAIAHACLLCEKQFIHFQSYLHHKLYNCQIYMDELSDTENDAPSGWVCSYCEENFSSETTLNEHAARHLGDFTARCLYCQETYPWNKEKEHVITHRIVKPATSRLMYPCVKCDKLFFSYIAMLEHHRKKHLRKRKKSFLRAINGESSENHDPSHSLDKLKARAVCLQSSPRQCEFCAKKFSVLESYLLHITVIHHKVIFFPCPYCNFETDCKCGLLQHVDSVHSRWPKLIQSSYFDPIMENACRLNLELFSCELCQKRIHQRDNLLQHLRTTHKQWLQSSQIVKELQTFQEMWTQLVV